VESQYVDDDLDMAEVSAVNSLVVVRVALKPPVQIAGVVVTARPMALAARLDSAAEFGPEEPLLLLTGGVGSRQVARARFGGSQNGVTAFRLKSQFRSFDARSSTRVPMEIDAEVRSVLGSSRQRGVVLDVSPGGMAVAVATRPGGRAVEVLLAANGYAASLPCETVGVTQQEESAILHLRFEALSAPQQAFVRQLIASATRALGIDLDLAS
jgi:hypothetical protein